MERPLHSSGVIILAAGNSSRLGEPKQMLTYNGKALIRNLAEAATALETTVVVVTGAHTDIIVNELAGLSIDFAYNADWQTGMGSSIRTGVRKMLHLKPYVDNIILTVSDQPFVTVQIFEQLIQAAQSNSHGIVASGYDHTMGTPALFGKNYFDALIHLNESEGAKKLFARFENDVVIVPFPKGIIDIDTREDYEKLLGL